MNKKIKDSVINIGTGIDYSIKEYARIISSRINPKVDLKIKFDRSKPNGTPRKVLDISLAKNMDGNQKSNLMRQLI
jgi:GDP-L-fucose synthase